MYDFADKPVSGGAVGFTRWPRFSQRRKGARTQGVVCVCKGWFFIDGVIARKGAEAQRVAEKAVVLSVG